MTWKGKPTIEHFFFIFTGFLLCHIIHLIKHTPLFTVNQWWINTRRYINIFPFHYIFHWELMFFKELIKSYPLTFFERLELIELIDSKFLLKLIFFYIIKIFFQLSILDIWYWKCQVKNIWLAYCNMSGLKYQILQMSCQKPILIHIKIRKLNLLWY